MDLSEYERVIGHPSVNGESVRRVAVTQEA